MSNVKQETINGAKWGLLQKLTVHPIQLVYGMLLARLITPAEMGIVGLTSIFFAIATQLASAGFGSALIRKLDRTEADCSTMFWFNVGMSFLASFLLFLLAPWFADFYNQEELVWLTRASAFNMFLSSIAGVHWTLYQCRRDFKTPAIVNCITTLAGMPVCLILAWLGWGVWALMWQSIFTTLLSFCIIWSISPWKPRMIFSKESFFSLFGFGSKLALAGIIHVLYVNGRTFIIGKFYSAAQLGLYNRGSAVAHLAPDLINNTLSGVMYPVLATLQDDNERLKAAYRKYVRIPTLLVAWSTMILISMATPAVDVMYGKDWLPCVPFLQIIAIGWAVNHMNGINCSLMMIKGRSDILLKLETFKKSISIGMLLYAATISVEAICWASTLYCHLALAFNAYFTGKILGLTWWQQQKDIFPYFILAGLACIPAYLCTFTELPSIIQLLIGGPVSLVLYFIPLHLFRESAYKELFNTFIAPRLSKKISFIKPL